MDAKTLQNMHAQQQAVEKQRMRELEKLADELKQVKVSNGVYGTAAGPHGVSSDVVYIGDPISNNGLSNNGIVWQHSVVPEWPNDGASNIGPYYPNQAVGQTDKVSELAKEVMDLLRGKNKELVEQADWLRKQIDELQVALKTKDQLIEKLVDGIYGTKESRKGSNGHSSREELGDLPAAEDTGSEASC